MTSQSKKIITLIVCVVAVSIFSWTVWRGFIAPPTEAEVAPTTTPKILYASSSLPARLQIPILGIDTEVQHVGVTKKGTMGVPSNYKDVGWYKYGPIPGTKGSAVIAGHLDNGFGRAAVFKNLQTLKAGDSVYVIDKDGAKSHFRVVKSSVFEQHTSTEEAFGDSGMPRLNLITCDGDFDPENKVYSHRYIVFTEYVGPV